MAVTYERSCKGKKRFSTRKIARQHRRQTKLREPAKGPLSVYPCDFCGFFHLGHLPPEVRKGELDKAEWRYGR